MNATFIQDCSELQCALNTVDIILHVQDLHENSMVFWALILVGRTNGKLDSVKCMCSFARVI